MVLAQCRRNFPDRQFELKVIKTTGDKLQVTNLAAVNEGLPKGLFTKELEVALLNREADFAVHSLKDLPTELPQGLYLSAVSEREEFATFSSTVQPPSRRRKNAVTNRAPNSKILLPAQPSPPAARRRQAQILALRPDLKCVPIRGNVGTRMQKLSDNAALDGTVLALAGMKRLGYTITSGGEIHGHDVAPGLLASILPLDQMLPCVGQAALGFESRLGDAETDHLRRAESPADLLVRHRRTRLSPGNGRRLPKPGCSSRRTHRLATPHSRRLFPGRNARRGELTGPANLGCSAPRLRRNSL